MMLTSCAAVEPAAEPDAEPEAAEPLLAEPVLPHPKSAVDIARAIARANTFFFMILLLVIFLDRYFSPYIKALRALISTVFTLF
jgi:hypothetical protein